MSIKQGGNTIAGAVGKYPLNERNISNCITEIPQDIKLELSSGTLTLKAGSKLYVPNGVGVYNGITVAADVVLDSSLTSTYGNGDYLWCYNPTLNKIQGGNNVYNQCQSGTYDGTQYCMFYDTTNNVIKYTANSGSTWESGYSLPFTLTTLTNGVGLTSIDQVFNGFGYIGSTVFALPGVKGLIPDGRNTDGTLKNINFTVENITTNSLATTGWHGMWSFYFNGVDSAAMIHPTELEYISDSKPTGIYTTTAFWYSPSENKLYYTQDIGSTWTQIAYVRIDFTETSQKITSIDTEYPFRAVGYRDTEYMAHQSMPSNRYNSLTVGASGTTYTAPADGWFYISAKTSGTNYQVIMAAGYMSVSFRSSSLNQRIILPVSKGMVMTLNYDGTLSDTTFRFIYAQGAQ